MNLYERIEEAMRDDDESSDRKSSRLLDDYEKATKEERAAIDNMFTTLTGWRLATLIDPPWDKKLGGN